MSNGARGETTLVGKSGREYEIAFTLEALMSFEQRTRTPAMEMLGRIVSSFGDLGDVDVESDDFDPQAMAALMTNLSISVTETYELLRAGLLGARRRRNSKVETIRDQEVGQIFSDCGGTVTVFTDLVNAFVDAEDLLGDLALDDEDDDEDGDDPEGDDVGAVPTGDPGGSHTSS